MMTSRPHRPRARSAALRALSGLLIVLLGMVAASPAVAAEADFRPVLVPIDQGGASYFDLEMDPGEVRELQVEIGNDGSALTPVRAYASDAYTIINGGFGSRLSGDPKTGPTGWLDFKDEVIELPAGQAVERAFHVAVPAATAPGQYVTSLVVENRDPIKGEGGIAVDQVIRQAIAVVVTVPGEISPALGIGGASYVAVSDHAFVRIAVQNPGNVLLKPTADVTITTAAGAEIDRRTIEMDSFYAFNETQLEVALAERLAPGAYLADVMMRDPETGAEAAARAIPFEVAAPVPTADPGLPGQVTDAIDRAFSSDPVLVTLLFATFLFAALSLFLVWRMWVTSRRRDS